MVNGRGVLLGLSTVTVVASLSLLAAGSPAYAADAPVGLGTVAPYSVLGGQTVTNTGPTSLSGSLGVSPGTAITGFPPGIYGGDQHAADAVAAKAQSDLRLAYDDAASRAPTANVAGDLVGQTLTPGVYKSTSTLALTGTLTLDGQGDPASVFIFQVADALTTFTASNVSVLNGAQACHVFWQIGTSATLGTSSSFKGTIMALSSISVNTGVTVQGRALARNGQVSLDNDVFTAADCDTTTPTSGSSGGTSATPTTTVTRTPTTSQTAAGSSAAGTTQAATPTSGVTQTAIGASGTGTGTGTSSLIPTNLAVTGSNTLRGAPLGIGATLLILGGGLLILTRARPDRASPRKH